MSGLGHCDSGEELGKVRHSSTQVCPGATEPPWLGLTVLSLLCAENALSVVKDSPAARLCLTHTWSCVSCALYSRLSRFVSCTASHTFQETGTRAASAAAPSSPGTTVLPALPSHHHTAYSVSQIQTLSTPLQKDSDWGACPVESREERTIQREGLYSVCGKPRAAPA